MTDLGAVDLLHHLHFGRIFLSLVGRVLGLPAALCNLAMCYYSLHRPVGAAQSKEQRFHPKNTCTQYKLRRLSLLPFWRSENMWSRLFQAAHNSTPSVLQWRPPAADSSSENGVVIHLDVTRHCEPGHDSPELENLRIKEFTKCRQEPFLTRSCCDLDPRFPPAL